MEPAIYDAEWTEFVIPQRNGQIESCKRYNASSDQFSINGTILENTREYNVINECQITTFNRSNIISCSKNDRLVFRDQMSTISKDVNCQKNFLYFFIFELN